MKSYAVVTIFLLLIPNLIIFETDINKNFITDDEIIIISDNDPYFAIIGSNLALNYSDQNSINLKPLLIQKNGKLTDIQENFIKKYFNFQKKKLLILGEKINTDHPKKEILGNISKINIEAIKYKYKNSAEILIIPYGKDEKYELSLVSSLISNYLNIPIIIFNNNSKDIKDICSFLNVKNAYIIGNINIELPNINKTIYNNLDEIQNKILKIIKEKFGKINYITITNPSDIIPPYIIEENITKIRDNIINKKITILGKTIELDGEDTKYYPLDISNGIYKIEIFVNITKSNNLYFKNNTIQPILYLNVYDKNNSLIAYSSSLGYSINKSYVDTLVFDSPGNYSVQLKIYNGIKGGYFIQRGISIADIEFELTFIKTKLEKPHMPLIPKLSMLAPYITSAHGGIIIADPKFEITDDSYYEIAKGRTTGPWYNLELHEYNNQKVNYTIDQLEQILNNIEKNDMLNGYLNGPAWMAILGDTNMIPMYYYKPSQQGLLEKGLPSDNPYYLDFNLSIGRIVSYNVQDVADLISRTLFYEKICNNNLSDNSWHNKFNFIFGEGFGETGGIFHQIPYSKEIQDYGFITQVYGDLRNSRQISEKLGVYKNTNYIEYLGHADWFWFTPSLYGLDIYSKAIDIANAKDWIYENPSIFLTSACLMSRIDGIPPFMNIGLTMLHAGCNTFIGATRETGQEAGLEIFENCLIVDNFSVGEALREEKRIDKELPTFYVRTLYGDPAFNPYEPNNGFNNQGIP
jgi:hypothetical protein